VIKLLMSDGSKQVQLAMFSEEEMRLEEGGQRRRTHTDALELS
jgi:hypothetical protein